MGGRGLPLRSKGIVFAGALGAWKISKGPVFILDIWKWGQGTVNPDDLGMSHYASQF